jgi:hypothetical protein
VFAWGTHRVVIRTVLHDFFAGDNACTGDLAPTTSVIRLPAVVDGSAPIEVTVDGHTVRLTRDR